MRDEWEWRAYFAQELALRQPACEECRMHTFHLPWCSHAEVTARNIAAARDRRALIEELERDR